MKKDNIIIFIAAAVLVLSSAALNCYTKDKAYPPKIKTAEAGEFLAAAKVNYDEASGTIDVKVRTNAPDGSVIKVSAQHPYTTEDMEEFKVVDGGKVSSVFTVPEELPSYQIPVVVELDMNENQHSKKTVEMFGANGEKLSGDNVENKDGVNISTVKVDNVFYPNEKTYKNDLFTSYIYYSIVEPYSAVFESIQPSESGNWNEFHVYLTEQASSEESWATMTDDILKGFYEMFEGLVKEADIILADENVDIFFHHSNGEVLAKNH